MAGEDNWSVGIMAVLVAVLVALLITVAVYASRTPMGAASKTSSGTDVKLQRPVGDVWTVNKSPVRTFVPDVARPDLDEQQYEAPPADGALVAGLGGVKLDPIEGDTAIEYAPEVEEIFENANNRITAVSEQFLGQPETRYQGVGSGGDDAFMALFGTEPLIEAWPIDRCNDALSQRMYVGDYVQKLCESIHGQVFNIGRNFKTLS